jgi:hypothetical protein
MTEEAPFSPESGQDSTETGYQKFIQQKVEALNTPEYHDVYAWYKERVEAMPEMETSPAPLTDGDKWKYTETEDGEIDEIRSGFFSMEGRAVKTPTFSWNQPGIIAAEAPMDLPTPEGNYALETSGFVGVMRDVDGNVLLSVGQEPLAQTPKKALVRTPFQTSVAKLQGLLNGQRELDPTLADILEKVGNGKLNNGFGYCYGWNPYLFSVNKLFFSSVSGCVLYCPVRVHVPGNDIFELDLIEIRFQISANSQHLPFHFLHFPCFMQHFVVS